LKLLYKVAVGQLNELEDNREYKPKPEETGLNEENEATGEKTDHEMRKFSVDSGVILLAGDVENSDDQSDQEKPVAAPSSPSAYNLRQRRGRENYAFSH